MKRPAIVLIGFGAIARIVVDGLAANTEGARIAAVLVRKQRAESVRAELGAEIEIITEVRDIDAIAPDLVVECAGQGAIADYGEAVLAGGHDLLVIATGALADAGLRARLEAAAARSGARMLLPAGAIAGIDGLGALRVGGLSAVRYTSIKPPQAWKGTPAEETVDLEGLRGPTVFFTGPAAEAARLYPKNANLAATVALAGIGLDETEIQLVADPTITDNIARIEATGTFGRLSVELAGPPAPDNPKTSAITAHSILHAIANRHATLVI